MAAKYLNDDVITEILLRLPVKSLLRFQSVCKSWQSLIKSQNFIRSHLNQSHKTTDRSTYDPIFLLYHKNSNSEEEPNHEFHLVKYSKKNSINNSDQNHSPQPQVLFRISPPETSDETETCFRYKTKLIGFCDGIMCILWRSRNTIMLFNASSRKRFEVPVPRISLRNGPRYRPWVDFGFGHDSRHDDYKIVCAFFDNRVAIGVQVYSLKSHCWKQIIDLSAENVRRVLPSSDLLSFPCLANGRLHWKAVTLRDEKILLSFDLADESFREVELPPRVSRNGNFDFLPSPTQHGMVCLSMSTEDDGDGGSASIWVMREYGVASSWTETRVSHDCVGEDFAVELKKKNINNNGFTNTSELSFYCYDGFRVNLNGVVERGEIKNYRKLEFHREHAWLSGFANYMESLVLLNQGKSV